MEKKIFNGVTTVDSFYSYLESIMPLKRIIISLTVGMIPLFVVLFAGLNNRFVDGATVASRTFDAFLLTSLICFIFLMSCEEYAIFKTKKELEHFVDDASVEDAENFNREEYLREDDDEPSTQDDSFRPMDLDGLKV